MYFFIQFIMNYWPLHVSGTACSSSGGAAPTKICILFACYVCWLLPGLEWNIPIVVGVAPPEDEQVVLETCTGR
jgi:hypothetical protein